MAERTVDNDELVDEKPAKQVPRLCNEIQLFDLCDLESCASKQGAFCTNPDLLGRFEAIAEEEERPAARGVDSDDLDDGMGDDDESYGDAFDDEFDDDGYQEDE